MNGTESIEIALTVAVAVTAGVAGYALREVIRLKRALLGEMQRALELDVTKAYVDLREKVGSGP